MVGAKTDNPRPDTATGVAMDTMRGRIVQQLNEETERTVAKKST